MGERAYQELHRPQFHYTPKKYWTNDPNGLVFYKGEYHLFYQLNAQGIKWGPNTWGHAVSPDLVHWTQLAHAIEPDDYGWIWSGSAVVDWNNTSGLKSGSNDTLVALYSTGGLGKFGFPNTPVVQKMAFSNDCGRTWNAFDENPVIEHIRAENRDPKVIWHGETGMWIMALYLDGDEFAIFSSKDLKAWKRLCFVQVSGTSECPDFFPLAVDGNPENVLWVFWGGGGVYRLGQFDGRTFQPETDAIRCEFGANGYAAQTWSDVPSADGRRIQISWMAGGKYPSMPFNQQMSFPVELSLRTFPEGVRLCREPVREIALLNERPYQWNDLKVDPQHKLSVESGHDLFRITATVELNDATAFGFVIRGIDLRYNIADGAFTYLGRTISAPPDNARLEIEILVDRTSMELFVSAGKVSASFCYLPEAADAPVEIYAEQGTIRMKALVIRELASSWR